MTFNEYHRGWKESSSSEIWVIISHISVKLVAAASDTPDFQGVFMLCDCLREGEVLKVAALRFSKAS